LLSQSVRVSQSVSQSITYLLIQPVIQLLSYLARPNVMVRFLAAMIPIQKTSNYILNEICHGYPQSVL